MAHYEPSRQDLHFLQINYFGSFKRVNTCMFCKKCFFGNKEHTKEIKKGALVFFCLCAILGCVTPLENFVFHITEIQLSGPKGIESVIYTMIKKGEMFYVSFKVLNIR